MYVALHCRAPVRKLLFGTKLIMCFVTAGIYIPVEVDGHWVKKMWTFDDITKSKVRTTFQS